MRKSIALFGCLALLSTPLVAHAAGASGQAAVGISNAGTSAGVNASGNTPGTDSTVTGTGTTHTNSTMAPPETYANDQPAVSHTGKTKNQHHNHTKHTRSNGADASSDSPDNTSSYRSSGETNTTTGAQ